MEQKDDQVNILENLMQVEKDSQAKLLLSLQNSALLMANL